MISVLKTEAQYKEVLERVGELVSTDPAADSDEGRELEVLALLIKDFERRNFPLAQPSPLAAIRLRMDQRGLAPKDLVPYLGSRSKVSEVLSGKRPLSLSMIRELHSGLQIPLESLVSEQVDEAPADRLEWDRFPIKEMLRRCWIDVAPNKIPRRPTFADARDILEGYFKPIGGPMIAAGVLHKKDRVRTARTSDRFALAAWTARILRLAQDMRPAGRFDRGDWDQECLRELRGLSRYDVGPRLAIQFLSDHGILVAIEAHLPRTRLDGAAMLRSDGVPVIGLTLRHDRLDNFWFTLFHELMHVLHHLNPGTSGVPSSSYFIDDLDVPPDAFPAEKEADELAREALLPQSEWEMSAARFVIAPAAVEQLARQVGVGDAVVAGRVRFERGNYRLLGSMVGSGRVRNVFPDLSWPTSSM